MKEGESAHTNSGAAALHRGRGAGGGGLGGGRAGGSGAGGVLAGAGDGLGPAVGPLQVVVTQGSGLRSRVSLVYSLFVSFIGHRSELTLKPKPVVTFR